MKHYSLFVQYDLCFGCHACEVACKQENGLPVGQGWISVKQVGPKRLNGRLVMDFIPMTCRHCGNPPCRDVCPAEAITKGEDGIVKISDELCIGCNACLEACPFGAPQFNPEMEVVQKCHLCEHRILKGLPPACVQTCPAGAILFGDSNEIAETVRKQKAVFLGSR